MKHLVNPDTVAAMLQRGRTRMVQAVLYQSDIANPQKMYDFWHGFADCAAALLHGHAEGMALRDQSSDPQRAIQAALAGLPDHCERLSFVEMERLMRAQGINFAADAVAHGNIDTVVQLQDGVRAVIKFDDKHSVAGIDVQDGGKLHGDATGDVELAIVLQGGAV